jgi:hypothetical protein
MPSFLYDFQALLVEWSLVKGRSAIFADCGLGKTPMQLVWAENVVRKTNKPVLILTPLAVASQHVSEGAKFGIEVVKSKDGKAHKSVTVTNYERLHYFNPEDFSGVVCDESSILKNFDGVTRSAVTEFMRRIRHRLLCTATAAPNDYVELGTSSEAIGYLGFMDMIGRFFKQDKNFMAIGARVTGGDGRIAIGGGKYRFRGHAQRDFWRWVCSWARAVRKPSDMGCDDKGFDLPELRTRQHIVQAKTLADGWLFSMPAHGLQEERDERRRTVTERCEKAAELACSKNGSASVLWCNLNDEGDLLAKIVPGAKQVSGSDSDDRKEEVFDAFVKGEVKRLVTKCSIAGWGLNWQHCAHQTFFPSHSFEQWYQAVRRSWRFGQKNPVTIDVVTSEGESRILANLQRKASQAEEMFAKLVELMNQEISIDRTSSFNRKEVVPKWLKIKK